MRIIAYIIKGILMYSTLIYWIFIICLADSSFTFTGILIVFGVGFAMIFICKYALTLEDVAILTGNDSKKL